MANIPHGAASRADIGRVSEARPLVMGHRGACGYLPEHTLESVAYAHALGVDFVEQDVVLSRDGVLVVCHDIHVDTTTDVAVRFPGRARADGRYYAIDFDWEELRSLTVRERFDPVTGKPVFPGRFPHEVGASFRLCTFEEQLMLLRGLNHATGRSMGSYVEFKAPAWHAAEGRDSGAALLDVLARHGLTRRDDPVIVQSFDPAALRRLRDHHHTQLRLVQLIGQNAWNEAPDTDYDAISAPEGLRAVAAYADGVGPDLSRVLSPVSGGVEATSFVGDAHGAGLFVHPYTVRADDLPPAVVSLPALLDAARRAGVDGLFTDQPDLVLRHFAQAR